MKELLMIDPREKFPGYTKMILILKIIIKKGYGKIYKKYLDQFELQFSIN